MEAKAHEVRSLVIKIKERFPFRRFTDGSKVGNWTCWNSGSFWFPFRRFTDGSKVPMKSTSQIGVSCFHSDASQMEAKHPCLVERWPQPNLQCSHSDASQMEAKIGCHRHPRWLTFKFPFRRFTDGSKEALDCSMLIGMQVSIQTLHRWKQSIDNEPLVTRPCKFPFRRFTDGSKGFIFCKNKDANTIVSIQTLHRWKQSGWTSSRFGNAQEFPFRRFTDGSKGNMGAELGLTTSLFPFRRFTDGSKEKMLLAYNKGEAVFPFRRFTDGSKVMAQLTIHDLNDVSIQTLHGWKQSVSCSGPKNHIRGVSIQTLHGWKQSPKLYWQTQESTTVSIQTLHGWKQSFNSWVLSQKQTQVSIQTLHGWKQSILVVDATKTAASFHSDASRMEAKHLFPNR